jgi:type VI protein secretion system component VasK
MFLVNQEVPMTKKERELLLDNVRRLKDFIETVEVRFPIFMMGTKRLTDSIIAELEALAQE